MVMALKMVVSQAAGKPRKKSKFGDDCRRTERIAGVTADFRGAERAEGNCCRRGHGNGQYCRCQAAKQDCDKPGDGNAGNKRKHRGIFPRLSCLVGNAAGAGAR